MMNAKVLGRMSPVEKDQRCVSKQCEWHWNLQQTGRIYDKEMWLWSSSAKEKWRTFPICKIARWLLLVGLHVLPCRFHLFWDYVFFNELILIISCQTLHLLMFHVTKTTLPFLVNLYKIPVKCCFLPLCEGVTLGFFPFSYSFVLHSIFRQEKTQWSLPRFFQIKCLPFPDLPLELPQEILDVLSYQRKPNLHERNSPGNSDGNLFGMVKWPFQRLTDLPPTRG